jgi:molybdopterin molybdotransferase
MAQLTDDCFAFSGPLLPVEEVERIIRERVTPVAEVETVPLHAASGRVIAREVVAPMDLPPCAMPISTPRPRPGLPSSSV